MAGGQNLKNVFVNGLKEQRNKGAYVSGKCLQAQAKIFYGEIYQNQSETKTFDASKGWLYNFLQRQKLALTTTTTTTTASPQTLQAAPDILSASPHFESGLTTSVQAVQQEPVDHIQSQITTHQLLQEIRELNRLLILLQQPNNQNNALSDVSNIIPAFSHASPPNNQANKTNQSSNDTPKMGNNKSRQGLRYKR
jgi:hypothetical protein